MSLDASRCHCEDGELCTRCTPPALLNPRGGDGMFDVSELYERERPGCACLAGELCRFCQPQLAILVHRAAAELVRAPLSDDLLGRLQRPSQRLSLLAQDN